MNLANGVYGALAGWVATAPMSLAMAAMHRVLPAHHQYDLPPEEITKRAASGVADGADVRPADRERRMEAAALAAHFGFGAAGGALYGLLPAGLRARPLLGGVLFGLLVWSVSYLGWLPVAGLYPRAHHEPAGRNTLMILAHVVWGGVLGALVDRLERPAGSGSSR